jgi:hypothetical protein
VHACRLWYSARNAHAPYCHLWPVRLYNIFQLYLINGSILEKKNIEHKCVFFYFFYKFCLKIFSLQEELSEIWPKIYIGLCVKYPLLLSDFNDNWTFSTYFLKICKCQISLKSVEWEPSCSMRTDGRTDGQMARQADMTKVIVALRNFENAPIKQAVN